ncbi:MAG: DUF5720 family protein [Faecousia sp.]
MGVDCNGIGGHSELALERYRDSTRHMVIYDVLISSPRGKAGDRMRLFLTDEEYAAIKHAEKSGTIKIVKHAAVIEGHILPDKKRRR